jgi:hypothetical protein
VPAESSTIDLGRVAKNFLRSAKEVCDQRNAIKYTPYRINKFFSRCVMRAIGAIPTRDLDHTQVLDEWIDCATKLFDFALTHYTQLECAPECPCNEFYRDAPISLLLIHKTASNIG